MASLIRFLEATGNVWRVVVIVVACLAAFSFYQYKNNQPNLFSGDDVATIVGSVRTNTSFGFIAETFDRAERWFGFGDRNPVASTSRVGDGSATTAPDAGRPRYGRSRIVMSPTTANVDTNARPPTTGSGGAGALAVSVPAGSPTGAQELDLEGDTPDPRLRVAFRRFASQFCRATRAIATYYSDRVSGPDGFTGIRVGSGVRFPSLDRLTDGPERSLAEKELEVRLRCDYELAYGTGEKADPQRPAFEPWRQATLERQYGAMWTRIDLSHIRTPDDPMSRGEWYVLPEISQE